MVSTTDTALIRNASTFERYQNFSLMKIPQVLIDLFHKARMLQK